MTLPFPELLEDFALYVDFLRECEEPAAILDLPNVRQLAGFDCGPACLRSVALYYRLNNRTEAELIRELSTDPQKGTQPANMVRWFQEHGFPTEVREQLTLDDLNRYWQAGIPVIVLIQDYGTKQEFRTNQAGHYVCVCGLWSGYVIVQDPSATNLQAGDRPPAQPDTVQDFGKVMIRQPVFDSVWHDVDANGELLTRYGIAVGRPRVIESIQESITQTHTNTQLRSHAKTHQTEAAQQGDAAANDLDAAMMPVLNDLVELYSHPTNPHYKAADLYRQLEAVMIKSLGKSLKEIAEWSYEHTANNLTRILSVDQLRAAAIGNVTESRVQEDVARPVMPGLAVLGIGPQGLTVQEPAMILRDTSDMTEEEQRAYFNELLFEPPTLDEILAVMNQAGPEGTWQEQLARATSLASPQVLAPILTQGYAAGKTRAQIAQDLLEALDGVRSSAQRVARTEGLRMAHSMAMDANKEIDELVIAYQIHATPGPNSRPWHQARSSTVYYKEPAGDQKGYMQMPRPPEEAEDPSQRPPGTPQTAYN
jgi:hypothetical protein